MLDEGKDWWPQAEAVVGFHNAFELTGDPSFAQAAFRCWKYVQEQFVDRTHGDWFKRLDLDGTPDPLRHKSGPWECPYHHSRMCLEMLNRLDSSRERV
jgi:mannobiose 2-epimerase